MELENDNIYDCSKCGYYIRPYDLFEIELIDIILYIHDNFLNAREYIKKTYPNGNYYRDLERLKNYPKTDNIYCIECIEYDDKIDRLLNFNQYDKETLIRFYLLFQKHACNYWDYEENKIIEPSNIELYEGFKKMLKKHKNIIKIYETDGENEMEGLSSDKYEFKEYLLKPLITIKNIIT
jgi:hypothetical protein